MPQHRVSCTESPSLAQEVLPVKAISLKGLLAFGVALAHSFPPPRRGWKVPTEPSGSLSAVCCLLTQDKWRSLFYHTTWNAERKVNQAIGKCIIDLMGKWICLRYQRYLRDISTPSEFFPDLCWAQGTQLLWWYDSALNFGTSCSELIIIVNCRAVGVPSILIILLTT